MNLADSLERDAQQFPDKLAVIFKDQRCTYRDYDEQVNRIGNALRSLGVERGDRVAIMLGNRPEWLFSFYGIMKLGAIAVPINVMLKGEEVRYILGNSQAKAVVVGASLLPVVEASRGELPDLRHVVVVDGEQADGILSYETLTRESSPALKAVETTPDERMVIAYTSGTTGMPKGAVHTHEAIDVQIRMSSERLCVLEQDVQMTVMPVFSFSILISGPMLAVHNGLTLYLMERYNVLDFVQQIKEWRVSLTFGVPTVWIETTRLPEEIAREVDFSSVRVGMIGSAPMPPGLRDEFEAKYNFRFLQAYGGTEAPSIVSTDPLHGERKFDSVGTILPHIHVKIVDDDDNEVPLGTVGEICTGPQTTGPYAGVFKTLKEYWRMPEATAEAMKGGYFHWGDLGYLDEDGFLYLVDRKKDMIIRGGHNVYPKELENVLYDDPRIQECTVVGVPHQRLGEVPKAFIRLRSGATATEQEFIDLVRDRLAKFKALEYVEFVEDFPRNAMGKILKRELRDQARATAAGKDQG
ncbi:MAG: AMP-dependent synthetase [Chloroflexota bacterium]|nr:MAG: AMP-dependent synthetase [Chloroflexota bacterium]